MRNRFVVLALILWCAMVCEARADAGAKSPIIIEGKVVDAATGLPLSGAKVSVIGASLEVALSDNAGSFRFTDLAPGHYYFEAERAGYQTGVSEPLLLTVTKTALQITIALQRIGSTSSAVPTIGSIKVLGTQSLQKSSVSYQSVSAANAEQRGIYRAADALLTLPSVVYAGAFTAAPGDSVGLSIRGLGSLETAALLDGHPLGYGFFGYDYILSPMAALREVEVTYGSGANDLYGVDAIGGVVNLVTLDPTREPSLSVSQGYGTFGTLLTGLKFTGSESDGRLGYAIALGTQGEDGPFNHAVFYQPGAAFDASATDSAVRRLAVYQDDTSIFNRSALVKFRLSPDSQTRITISYLAMTNWTDRTGNGDNDYLPYDTALAMAKSFLSGYTAPSPAPTPPFSPTNPPACAPGTFLATNANGVPNGWGPTGQPDGGKPCQTPQQWAAFNTGWHGIGQDWVTHQANDGHLRLERDIGKTTLAIDGFSNFTKQVGNIDTLPFISTPGDNNIFSFDTLTNSGLTVTADSPAVNDDIGLGYYFDNIASYFTSLGSIINLPIVNESAFFVRDAHRANSSPLTTYVNAWFKHSTLTHTSYVDPRLGIVYDLRNDVVRAAVGGASTQPSLFEVDRPFTPFPPGSIATTLGCIGVTAIGLAPASLLTPERASDEELGYGHRWAGDSQTQITLYNENLYNQIYFSTLPLSATGSSFVPTSILSADEALLSSRCGSSADPLALLGTDGYFNIAHVRARGLDFQGRQRLSPVIFLDYTYSTNSSSLIQATPQVLQGDFTLIPGSQLPRVPLHTYSISLDYSPKSRLEATFTEYHVSDNNPKDLPAYSYANLALTIPMGRSSITGSIDNLFNQNAFYKGLFGEGKPLPLNQYATPSDYAPLIGASATERYGLPFRTINLFYTLRVI